MIDSTNSMYQPGYNDGKDAIEHYVHTSCPDATFTHGSITEADILALGCSFTEGACIPPEQSWPQIVADLTNKTVKVIAMSGVGIGWMWEQYLLYTTQSNKFNEVMLLVPDLFRHTFKSQTNHNKHNTHKLNWVPQYKQYYDKTEPAKIRQHDGQRADINTSVITHLNLQALNNFEHHTQHTNKTFTHSTWWHPTHYTLSKLNYPNYTPLNLHCDHQPQTKKQHKWWNTSRDGNHGGMHDQIHFAQTFLKKPITNNELATLP